MDLNEIRVRPLLNAFEKPALGVLIALDLLCLLAIFRLFRLFWTPLAALIIHSEVKI